MQIIILVELLGMTRFYNVWSTFVMFGQFLYLLVNFCNVWSTFVTFGQLL
jgi:hypothetical protein